MAKDPTKDVDKGRKQILREVDKIKGSFVTSGIHKGATPYSAGGESVPVALVAGVHEFGTDEAGPNKDITIPERAPIRNTWEKESEKWWSTTKDLKDKILALKITTAKALKQLGVIITADYKATLSDYDNKFPGMEITKETKEQKRRQGAPTQSLLRTGHLKESTTFEVHES